MDNGLLIIILATIPLIVLIVGLVVMARGGKVNKKYSNKIMSWRVATQAAAVLLLLAVVTLCTQDHEGGNYLGETLSEER